MPGERFIVGEDAVTTSREELDFGQSCQDINGRIVAGGNHYVPGPDSCTVCLCDEGRPKWCQAVLCAAPKDCKSFRIGSSCCEFICLDDEPGGSGGDSVVWDKDLGLRLLATTVTALLSLALLAFLLHRVLKKSRWSSRRRNRSACNEDEADGGPTSSLASYEHHGDLTSSVGHLSRQPAQMLQTGDLGQPIYLLWKEPDERHSENPPPPYSETDGGTVNNNQQIFLNEPEESTGLLTIIPSAPPQPDISDSLVINSVGEGAASNRFSSASVSMTTVVLVRRSNGTLDSELLDAGTPPPSYAEVLASGISSSALDQDLHNNPLQGGSEERQSTLSLPMAQRVAPVATGPASAIHRFSLQLSLMDMESTEEDEEEEDSLSGFSTSSSSSSSSASTAHPL